MAALFVLEFVFAQLWPSLHHAFFVHAVCPEHGELVHVSALSRTAVTARHFAEKSWLGDDHGSERAHDHCQLPPGVRDPATESAPALGPAERSFEFAGAAASES